MMNEEKEFIWDDIIETNKDKIKEVKLEMIKKAVFNPLSKFILMVHKNGMVDYDYFDDRFSKYMDVTNSKVKIIEKCTFKDFCWNEWAEEDLKTFAMKWLKEHNMQYIIDEVDDYWSTVKKIGLNNWADECMRDSDLYDRYPEELKEDYNYLCRISYLKNKWNIEIGEK